tara:strand:- start:1531 stop:1776 length:246 start_codon:yes stop_codon:yes gene_type:complete
MKTSSVLYPITAILVLFSAISCNWTNRDHQATEKVLEFPQGGWITLQYIKIASRGLDGNPAAISWGTTLSVAPFILGPEVD